MPDRIAVDHELLELVKTAIMSCTAEDSFTVAEVDVLVDDENVRSVLVLVQFNPFDCDEGRIIPESVTLQFDRQRDVGPSPGQDYCVMITGEESEWEITPGNVYAALYFNSLNLATTALPA